MLTRLLFLGACVGLLLMTGALDGCGRRHHYHRPAAADPPTYETGDGTVYQNGQVIRRSGRLNHLNSARVEQGAERATHAFTEGITAIAEGIEQGVVRGARDGARDARVQQAPQAHAPRHRHRRHHFSYSFETADPVEHRASTN